MKKLILVAAIAAATTVGSVNAATIYEGKGLTYKLKGDWQVQLRDNASKTKDAEVEFDDLELKNSVTYDLGNGLKAFGQLDFGFKDAAEDKQSGSKLEEAYLGLDFGMAAVAVGKQNNAADEFGVEGAYEHSVSEDAFDAAGQTDGDDVIRLDIAADNFTLITSTELEAEGENSAGDASFEVFAATSVGGVETLESEKPLPSEAYPSQLEKKDEEKVTLTFNKGEFIALNGQENKPEVNIENLNEIASKYAIGRDIHVGDTIVGTKGRVGFEAAAALITVKAHHLLEKHNLTKWQLQHKEYLSSFYGMHLHEGQYLDPVMRDTEAFLQSSQEKVTGNVVVTLKPYHFSLDGIVSDHDLMSSKFSTYGEENKAWSADDAKGFIKILGNQNKIYRQVNK